MLGGQTDGDSRHAGGGKQRSEVDPDCGKKLHGHDGGDDGDAGGTDDAGHGPYLTNTAVSGSVLLGNPDHP